MNASHIALHNKKKNVENYARLGSGLVNNFAQRNADRGVGPRVKVQLSRTQRNMAQIL